MNDDGYTLAEMLAALLIVGLAVSGLTRAVRVIGSAQTASVRTLMEDRALSSGDNSLARLLNHSGPFKSGQSNKMDGLPSRLRFDCGGTTPCGMDLAATTKSTHISFSPFGGSSMSTDIATGQDISLVYGGDTGPGNTWPPSGQETQTLHWIALVGGPADTPEPVMSQRIWRDEVPGCVFDIIAQTCRSATP